MPTSWISGFVRRIRCVVLRERQIFMVSGCALDRRFNRTDDLEAQLSCRRQDSVDRRLALHGILYDAALANITFADFELRLYQENYVGSRRGQFDNRRQYEGERNEAG